MASMLQLFSLGKKKIHNSLSIYVKSSGGNTLFLDLDPSWDIKNVKEIVAPKLGLEPSEVKIIFAGKELSDRITIAECDLGQQSILHAVKTTSRVKLTEPTNSLLEETEEQGGKPLCETLTDTMFSNEDSSRNTSTSEDLPVREPDQLKVHFYVFCPTCKMLKTGKVRVRCHFCKSGAFTVHADPQNWSDVLKPKQITGLCENNSELCADILNNREPTFAEFYFKCSEHTSLGEDDQAVPLYLIRPNLRNVPCLACADVSDPVLVFPCEEGHVTCLDCFRQYCSTRLAERQFWQHPEYGYTLACPAGCPDSFIIEVHHFRLLTDAQYVFCRLCLQGYHIGDCEGVNVEDQSAGESCLYSVDPAKAADARWDEASKVAIKVLTKPCPKCRTPTERDGGCMHMVCTRAGCDFHWCWVCQTGWTRECMGNHWFG